MNLYITRGMIIGLSALWLGGCGGGASNEPNSGPPDQVASNAGNIDCISRSAAEGIEGGGFRRFMGVIVELASDGTLIVGCARFSTNGAAVFVDGSPASLNDLDVGDFVNIDGTINPESGAAQASVIQVDTTIENGTVPAVRSGTLMGLSLGPGIKWNGSFGSVTADGDAGSAEDIHVGDVLVATGTETFSPLGLTHRADSTELWHLINGLVDWVDLEHDRLRVMGQPVTVAPLPRIPTGGSMELNDDSREQQRVLTQLRPGDRVVVSGHNSDSGEILATRVAVQSSIHPYVISGRVERPDAAQLRFALNALTIDYSVAQLQGFASGVPGAGDYVAAFGNLPPNGGIFEANRIIQLAGRFSGSSGATVEIEGLVTRVVSDVEFDVDGHPVELRRPAVCGDATTDVTVDTWVQLGGVLRSDGAVTDGVTGAYLCPVLFVDVDLIGPIDAISPGTLGLLGFAINDSVITQPGVDFSQLRVGDTVSVRATPGLTSHTLLASSITSAQAADPGSAQLDTRTYSLASPAINVAGRAILTTPATVYVDPQGMPESASWFFSKRWYVQCFKRSRDLSPLHLTLSRDERGQWLATRVAVSRFACPD